MLEKRASAFFVPPAPLLSIGLGKMLLITIVAVNCNFIYSIYLHLPPLYELLIKLPVDFLTIFLIINYGQLNKEKLLSIYELIERIVNSAEYSDAEKKVAVSVLSREAVSITVEETRLQAAANVVIERLFLALAANENPVPLPIAFPAELIAAIQEGFAEVGIEVLYFADSRNGVFYVAS